MPQRAQHLCRRALYRLAADDRAYRGDAWARAAHRLAHPAKRENRPDRDERIGRRDDHHAGIANRAERRAQRTRARRAAQLDSFHRAAKAPAHEVLLERDSPAPAHFNESAHAIVAHRHHLRAHAIAPRDLGRDAAKRLAGAHPFGAEQMSREVTIAKVEPGLAIEADERAERGEGL